MNKFKQNMMQKKTVRRNKNKSHGDFFIVALAFKGIYS